MKSLRTLAAAVLTATALAAASLPAPAAEPAPGLEGSILGRALVESRAWDKLSYLCDRIGHRLAGSKGLERAVEWTAGEFKRDGMDRVWTEEVMVPHWVRGEAEQARIVAPVETPMHLLALGGTVATPPEGIAAEVVEVASFEEVDARAEELAGKIVLFNKPIKAGFDREQGYGSAAGLRTGGAARAAKHGAVGMLIRSLGTADYRLPHTGAMRYEDGVPQIPAAAIAAEDAQLIHRLLESGDKVKVWMKLSSKTLPDAPSANVLAEIRGRELPDEIVLIGAHLDSWDVGQGAHDDGAGCAIVMETMRLLKAMGLTPRRTVRAVLFTNEENGLRGGRDYAERHAAERHVAAIESDSGGDAPRGFGVSAGAGGVEWVARLAAPLAIIDAATVTEGGGGADIGPIVRAGNVPALGLRQDPMRYFDYHHTEADTLDKVDRAALDRNVAALTLMTWQLAEAAETLPPPPPRPTDE